jgi:glycosyltransferase involved in cell wall biosynthesis
MWLEALSVDHDVTVVLVPLSGMEQPTDLVRERAGHWIVAPLDGALDPLYSLISRVLDPEARLNALCAYPRPSPCRFATSPALTALTSRLAAVESIEVPFSTVVVVRSYVAPYVAPFLEPGRSFRILDLDDDEQLTHSRLSALHSWRGRLDEARLSGTEAAKYAAHENRWMPQFDAVVAASGVHQAALRARHPGMRFAVVPNIVEIPDVSRAPRAGDGTLRVLFVGNLAYAPNVDGVLWLVEEILPLLAGRRPTALRIVGSNPGPEVCALVREGIEVYQNALDLTSHYVWADVAVAPLRAGSGTRLKILEAFAAGVPVVATTIGAEGLAVRDGEHLLVADSEWATAEACLRLAAEPRFAAGLVGQAHAFIRREHGREAGIQRLRHFFVREPLRSLVPPL